MMPSSSFAKNTKGAAGVHLVVAQLSLRGYVALPTTRNLKSVDIVAFNERLSRFAFIQVKSTDKPKGGWLVHRTRRHEEWEQDVRQALSLGARFFYVFVLLPNRSQTEPVYYVVPSKHVAQMIIDDMKSALALHPDLRPEGQPCAWGPKGLRPEVAEKYQDKWEDLKLDE
jgi:hypothetical protein